MTISFQPDWHGTERVQQVVIVGGGPAGCTAAHEAARLGLSGVVIERGAPYRDKSCGDMLVPNATAILGEFGLRLEEAGSPFPVVELRGRGRLLWRVTYPEEPVWIVPRRSLDQQFRDLLPKPMNMLYSASVTGVAQAGPDLLALSVRLADGRTIQLHSQTVIMAAGAHSPMVRNWGLCGQWTHRAIYLRLSGGGGDGGPDLRVPSLPDPRLSLGFSSFQRLGQSGYLRPSANGRSHAQGAWQRISRRTRHRTGARAVARWRRFALERAGDYLAP